jgi:hypothetical protein
MSPMYDNCKLKPKAVIFDLDGVLVNSAERFKRLDMDAYNKRNKKNFVKSVRHYNSNCDGDQVIPLGMLLLKTLCKDHKIFFITARGIEGYAPTLNWITSNFDDFFSSDAELIMHPEDTNNFKFSTQFDHAEFKKREACKIMESHDITCAIDDSIDNIRAYISLGIPTLQMTVPNLGKVLV